MAPIIKSSKTIKDYAPLGATSSIALQAEPGNESGSAPEQDESVESDGYVEPDVPGFGSALARDGNAVSDGNAEPGSIGEGTATKQPATKVRPGESSSSSARAYTKLEVNDLMLTPEGLRASDDLDGLDYDLRNLVLPEVCGEDLNRGELEKLIEVRGVRYCKFWTCWLKRKIADEYARGRPVQKPTALYVKAVRECWQVDPNWPEFDAELHTAAAREEASKRQKAAPAGPLIPGTTHTQDDVNRLADEIHCGEREMRHLPAYLYGPVQRRLDELESNSAAEEDEVEEFFGGRRSVTPKPDASIVEDGFDFGTPSSDDADHASDGKFRLDAEFELEAIPF